MKKYLELFPSRLSGIYFFDFGGGGGDAGEAAGQAAQAQVEASRIAANTQMEMYRQTREDVAPWRDTGEAALGLYASLLNIPGYGPKPTLRPGAEPIGQEPIYGPAPAAVNNLWRDPTTGQVHSGSAQDMHNQWIKSGYLPVQDSPSGGFEAVGGGGGGQPPITGYTPQYAPEDYITPDIGAEMSNYLRATPGYQFRMSEGVNALNRMAASKGMLYSGQQQKALTEYGQGIADQTYNAMLDRIANLSTGGQNAALGLGGIGAQTAGNVAQSQLLGGQAQAQGIYNAYNARQSAYTGGMNNLMGGLGLGTGILSSTGALAKIGSWIGGLFSDKRTKKHIKPLRRSALKKVNRLNPVTFKYKDEFGGDWQTGYVADEVEKVAPGAVVRGPGGLRMINPLAMNALLAQAVQEQQEQINHLRRAA